MIDYEAQYIRDKAENIRKMNIDTAPSHTAKKFMEAVGPYQYVNHYTWMGRPIIQLPQDIVAMQEVIMKVAPDLIIETGIAHGGSAVFFSSMLELLDIYAGCEIPREVVAIDIELRSQNRTALEAHPMYKRITVFDGSSTDSKIAEQVREIASRHRAIMVVLDSNHSHQHVYDELNIYGQLVTVGSYALVCDTCIEVFGDTRNDRPWGKGNNPYTAAKQWLSEHDEFVCDKTYDEQSLITSNPGGWLLRVK
ncbi:Cephalosporin hydroxylase [Desulfitobacterium hafniense DCB-2]|uniref:Cephalosporin hydroxylase n=1 Tax=Desulfitobacterium hafniense (strain DSM 10664 / DCB-2) TaxID=272564 RepID=B8FTV0_DESHD|nr:CmcI family methyltransferase [Desulfitobacterium hafniense]ACL22192.1 Cephalosporin hydroxylase [Desulfitobacterium hafniense DCB-2]